MLKKYNLNEILTENNNHLFKQLFEQKCYVKVENLNKTAKRKADLFLVLDKSRR